MQFRAGIKDWLYFVSIVWSASIGVKVFGSICWFVQGQQFDRNLAAKILSFFVQPEQLDILLRISLFVVVGASCLWVYVNKE